MKEVNSLDISQELRSFSKGNVQVNIPLRGYTSIRIGGQAAIFFEPENNIDLGLAIKLFESRGIVFRIIGNGTNLLIDDQPLGIAVIKLNSRFFKEIAIKKDMIFVRGGVNLSQLLNFSIKNAISGFEFLAGIPGSVGGALLMNAGVRHPSNSALLSISDLLIEIEVMDKQGEIFKLTKSEAGFVYRGSKLNDLIVLGAYFKLKKSTTAAVIEQIRAFIKRRTILQPKCLRSAGCVFKNPSNGMLSAGALIDKANLKGHRIQQAQVSDIHANFIINRGEATFSQISELMDFIKKKVNLDFGIKLEPEVEIWKKKIS